MEGIYAFRSKDVRPTPVYKGFLYIANTPFTSTDFCAISCNMYLRTSDSQKPPSPSPYSLKSAGPTHRVLRERKYVTEKKFIAAIEENGAEVDQLDEDIDVDKTDLDKGFRFGKSVVKVSSEELEFAKSTQEKELTILGFVQKDAVSLHLYTDEFERLFLSIRFLETI